MGKGKGKFVEFLAYTRRGQIIFEFSNLRKSLLRSLFVLIEKKIGLKLKMVSRF
jgi:ribosomal protein L16/L10AE